MSYVPPERWAHGDIPTAADMNKYSAALNTIRAAIGDAAVNVALRKTPNSGFWTMIHKHRWLSFKGTGTLSDMTGTETVSLEDVDDAVTIYDLQALTWLTYGSMYKVLSVSFAEEVPEP